MYELIHCGIFRHLSYC